MENQILAFVVYYSRLNLHAHTRSLCEQGLRKRPADGHLLFWRAYALLRLGSVGDALRGFESLQTPDLRDLNYAVLVALAHTHQQARLVDEDALAMVTAQLLTLDAASISDRAAILAATFSWLVGDLPRAKTVVSSRSAANTNTNPNPAAHTIQGIRAWIELSGTSAGIAKAQTIVDALGKTTDVLALLAKSKVLELRNQRAEATDVLSTLTVAAPWFVPALTERARLLAAGGEWDAAIETVQRVLGLDAYNIPALRILVDYAATRHRDSRPLTELVESVVQLEPHNYGLMMEIVQHVRYCLLPDAKAFSHTAGLCDKASQLAPQNASVLSEWGWHLLCSGDVPSARLRFKKARSIDEGDMASYLGLLRCDILEKREAAVAEQVEFVGAIRASLEPRHQAECALLLAKWYHVRGDVGHFVDELQQAIRNAPATDLTIRYEIARELVAHGPVEVLSDMAYGLLDNLCAAAPGFMPATVLSARAHYLARDYEGAKARLSYLASSVTGSSNAATNAEGFMLLAQIALQQGQATAASAALDHALSVDLGIRDSAEYALLRAQVLSLDADSKNDPAKLEEAVRLLESHESIDILIELASLYNRLGRVVEAKKTLATATVKVRGTPDEQRLLLVSAALAPEPEAIAMYKSVPQSSRYYSSARMALAQLYLNRGDRASYMATMEELAANNSGVGMLVALGDAMVNIHEVDRAMRYYSMARQQSKDKEQEREIAGKIGRALVQTYDYARAIDYFRGAGLKLELAELYLKLRDYDKAEDCLSNRDYPTLILLSKVKIARGQSEAAVPLLEQARKIQRTAEASLLLASLLPPQRAQEVLEDQLRTTPLNTQLQFALANVLSSRNDLDGCRSVCENILKSDPGHTQAAMLLSDILMRLSRAEAASEPIESLVKRSPTSYRALVELIHLLRRAGRLSDVSKYLKAAERASARAKFDAGLHYARGLYLRFTNSPREALIELNMARTDSEYAYLASVAMVNIYLNPDNRNEWTERDGTQECIEAEKILDYVSQEVMMTDDQKRYLTVLRAYCRLFRPQKSDQELALGMFSGLTRDDVDYVPGLVGTAVSLVVLKQTPKARNILKRVCKMQYRSDVSDEFETAHLLLADTYISAGKYDQAQELLKKAIQMNASCGRAWEASGLIFEKEASYKDAAECYEKAWAFGSERDPVVGYKLAFNYLKAKRYLEAVNVCHQVLAINENYPKIKKEILEKARLQIRV